MKSIVNQIIIIDVVTIQIIQNSKMLGTDSFRQLLVYAIKSNNPQSLILYHFVGFDRLSYVA